MVRYLNDRARLIVLARGRASDPNSDATAEEITSMRGVVAKLSWATREGMPNGSGDASLLPSTMPQPKVKDLQNANAALYRLMQAQASLWIKPIPLKVLRLIVFADSSLANTTGGSSQVAHMVCAAHADIHKGVESDVSPLFLQKS